MKAFNKSSKLKNSNKRKVSTIKRMKTIETKEQFDRIIKGNKISSSAVFCIDRDGKQQGVWAVRYKGDLNFVAQDVLAEGRLYAIGDTTEEYYDYMPRVNGYFVDIDAFPVFEDWVKFPITDVEIVSGETEISKKLIEKGMYTVIEPKEEDARYYVKYFNNISVGFQCRKGREYFNSEDFTYGMVERGDNSRINWLISRDIDIYEVVKKDGDIILEVERILSV